MAVRPWSIALLILRLAVANIVSLFVGIAPVHAADVVGSTQAKAPLVLSYVEQPYVTDVALPLIRETYDSLDIEVRFVEMPSHREMLEVSEGNIDGSVIASSTLFNRYDNIYPVQPSITESVFILLCQPHLPCDPAVLEETEATIAMTEASEKALRHRFPSFASQLFSINLLSAIPELIESGRVPYGIYVIEQSEMSAESLFECQYTELFRNPAYHVLAQKHQALLPLVSKALSNQISQKIE